MSQFFALRCTICTEILSYTTVQIEVPKGEETLCFRCAYVHTKMARFFCNNENLIDSLRTHDCSEAFDELQKKRQSLQSHMLRFVDELWDKRNKLIIEQQKQERDKQMYGTEK